MPYCGMVNHVELRAHDTMSNLESALKRAREPVLKARLKAIVLRKRGANPQEIAVRLLVSDRAVRQWVALYNAGGLSGLAPKPAGRKKGDVIWDASVFDGLAKEIDKGGYWSVPKMQEWLKEHHHKDIPEQTVWYRMNQLNYSYKSARPHPVQGNRQKQEDFKKGASYRSWSQ